MIAPVQTSSLIPACSGVLPSTFCRYWLMKKIDPNIPKYIDRDTALVTAKLRRVKNSIGNIGSLLRNSTTTNAITSTTPAASESKTSGAAQPIVWARISPNTSPNRPVEASPSPGRSSPRSGPWLSSSRRIATTDSATPTGTLIQKIQCQEAASITAPPTSGPSATAIPLIPDQTPRAMPRRWGGNASASKVRVSGVTIAPPTPWSARAAISSPVVGARAAAAEDAVNSAIPAMNIRLRPKRSPSAAPVSSSTA